MRIKRHRAVTVTYVTKLKPSALLGSKHRQHSFTQLPTPATPTTTNYVAPRVTFLAVVIIADFITGIIS
jgi:hypothetical protein